jgi:hypothetical protein
MQLQGGPDKGQSHPAFSTTDSPPLSGYFSSVGCHLELLAEVFSCLRQSYRKLLPLPSGCLCWCEVWCGCSLLALSLSKKPHKVKYRVLKPALLWTSSI